MEKIKELLENQKVFEEEEYDAYEEEDDILSDQESGSWSGSAQSLNADKNPETGSPRNDGGSASKNKQNGSGSKKSKKYFEDEEEEEEEESEDEVDDMIEQFYYDEDLDDLVEPGNEDKKAKRKGKNKKSKKAASEENKEEDDDDEEEEKYEGEEEEEREEEEEEEGEDDGAPLSTSISSVILLEFEKSKEIKRKKKMKSGKISKEEIGGGAGTGTGTGESSNKWREGGGDVKLDDREKGDLELEEDEEIILIKQKELSENKEGKGGVEGMRNIVNLVLNIEEDIEMSKLSRFINLYLLEYNNSSIRKEIRNIINWMWFHSNQEEKDIIYGILSNKITTLPSYGRNSAEYIELLGFIISDMNHKRYTNDFLLILKDTLSKENDLLMKHDNSYLYKSLNKYIELNGYYIENEPCLVCNDPEIPYQHVELNTLKSEIRYTATTQISMLVTSYTVQIGRAHV